MSTLISIQKVIDNVMVNAWAKIWGRNSAIFYWTHEYWQTGADPRVKDYLLVDVAGITLLAFLFTYVLMVKWILPRYMLYKKPYNLKNIIIAYDLSLVFINAYFFFYALRHVRDMWDFRNPKSDTSEKAMNFINTAHLYYLSKVYDLLDTVFMALKKKNSHISFLHVWHHFSVAGGAWLFMKYNPYMPTEYIFPLENGFVHVVMYGYYALAAMGPHMQKYLWWKKYITQMQIIQLAIAFIWFMIVVFKQTDMPFGYLFLNIGNDLALLVLFLNFYIQAYLKAKKQAKKVH